jgi:hypothetical protein
MRDLVPEVPRIAAMTPAAIETVRQVEQVALGLPQVPIFTEHVIHAGLYSRTVMVPADTLLTGALIKIATLLVIHGDALVYVGEQSFRVQGHAVLPASAGRKQAFVAVTDTYLTMVFPTTATTVEEAEQQFTDEAGMLFSRRDPDSNRITITGE